MAPASPAVPVFSSNSTDDTQKPESESRSFPLDLLKQDKKDLASRWRELVGRDNWQGLLDPIDPVLRSELIRYGEFAQACYDAFDYDPFSRYCGGCKYDSRSFFHSLGIPNAGYDITRYLYATSNIKLPNFSRSSKRDDARNNATNWIGFVAVSNDVSTARLGRRDIVIAWRGTVTKLEWMADLTNIQRSVSSEGIPSPDPSVKALAGFLDFYTDKNTANEFSKYSVREQVLAEIKRLVKLYAEERGEELSISVTGHSLGSALAKVCAYDLAEVGLHKVKRGGEKERVLPVTVYSFAGPRVGNESFKKRLEGALGVKSIRVVNAQDLVPKVPGVVINEDSPEWLRRAGAAIPWNYTHVGVKLTLDSEKSPYLKDTLDLAGFHNLEAHLHLLDGYQGTGQAFAPATGRDVTLVNKASDFLKEEQMVPPNWRLDANRGLILTADGRWRQPERARIEDHPDDIDQLLRQIGLPGYSNAK